MTTVISTVISTVITTVTRSIIGGGVEKFQWTPNFDGTAHGQFLVPFVPTGAGSTISVIFFYDSAGAAAQILDGDASAFSLSVDASDVMQFNLLTDVVVNGTSATSGATTIPGPGIYTITGTLDATADVDVLAATKLAAAQLRSQLHSLVITDPLDSGNSASIDTCILAAEMPAESGFFNGATKYGDFIGLDAQQQYVPKMAGDPGPVNQSGNGQRPDHPGNENGPPWEGGVNPTTKCITRTSGSGQVGSWPDTGRFDVGDIWVATNCAVIQIVDIPDVDEVCYNILQGNQGLVTKGFKYPNVFVGMKEGTGEAGAEWEYYNEGGTCPWPGLPVPDSPLAWVPNLGNN